MPTAANLNLYQGRTSRVGWHCDDEPLFGGCGEAKVTVSMSVGTRASFKPKSKSCPDGDANSCWLGHGDVLFMDGQCQDEILLCADPGLEQERINIAFALDQAACYLLSFLKDRSGVLFANVCAGFIRFCYGCSWKFCGYGRVLVFPVYPFMFTEQGLRRCAHRRTRPVGGGWWWHYLCSLLGVHRFPPIFAWKTGRSSWYNVTETLFVLALVRLPSLHEYYACIVYWVKGALQRDYRQNLCKTFL